MLERHRGAVLVVLAVWVLAVPTVFAEFPEAASWSLWVRVPIAIIWAVAAAATAVIATNQDERLKRFTEHALRRVRVDHERYVASILQALLGEAACGEPSSFRWTAYVEDGSGYLMPVFPEVVSDRRDPRVFAVGTGVVGSAFQEGGVVTAQGPAVSSGKFGLTEDQQSYFAGFQAVAGVSLVDARREPFGGLTAISGDASDYFETAAGSEALRDLADVVAAVLLRFSPE